MRNRIRQIGNPKPTDLLVGSGFLLQREQGTRFGGGRFHPLTPGDEEIARRDIGYFAVAHDSGDFITAYPWDGTFGTKITAPASKPENNGRDVRFSPDSDYLGIVFVTSDPEIAVYPWDGTFGTRVSNPSTAITNSGASLNWSPDGNYIAVGFLTTSPRIHVYAWEDGFGSKISDPGTVPTGGVQGVKWSPSNGHIAAAHATSPFASIYPWVFGAFGTKVADPATNPGSESNQCDWAPDGEHVGFATDSAPTINVYPWTGVFGTRIATPSPAPGIVAEGLEWSHSGYHIAIAFGANPRLYTYPWDDGFGTVVTSPGDVIAAQYTHVAFSTTDEFVGYTVLNTPFINVYPWAGWFGTKASNPGTLPGGNSRGVAFSGLVADAVDAGGPYVIEEGFALTLDATASAAPLTSTFTWTITDVGGTADFTDVIATGPNPTVPWEVLDNHSVDAGDWTIHLQIGGTGTDTATLYVNDDDSAGDWVIVTHAASPFVSAYPFTTSFGTKVANPTNALDGPGKQVTFSSDQLYVAMIHEVAGGHSGSVYPWAAEDGAFGTKYTTPTGVLKRFSMEVRFASDDSYIVFGGDPVGPFTTVLQSYSWAGGFGTAVSQFALPLAEKAFGMSFSPTDSHVALARHSDDLESPLVIVPFTAGVFGTSVALTDQGSTQRGYNTQFTKAGDYVFVSMTDSPYIKAFPWNGSTLGSAVSNPASTPSATATDVRMIGDDEYVTVSHSATPFISTYPWSAGFGTRISNPGTLPAGVGTGIDVTDDSDHVGVSHDATPFVTVYPFATAYGSKVADPATLPTGTGFGIDFVND